MTFLDFNLLGNKYICSHLQNKCILKILSIVVCFTPETIFNLANVLFACQRQLFNFQLHLLFNTKVLPIPKKMIFRAFARLVWDKVSFHLSWNWLSICPPRNSFTTSHRYVCPHAQLLLYLLNCPYLNPQICIDFTLLILFPILMGAVWGLTAYCVKPQQEDSKDKQPLAFSMKDGHMQPLPRKKI